MFVKTVGTPSTEMESKARPTARIPHCHDAIDKNAEKRDAGMTLWQQKLA
jgi:hypothetical protein